MVSKLWDSSAAEIKDSSSVNFISCENYVCTKRIASVKEHLALDSFKTSPLHCEK